MTTSPRAWWRGLSEPEKFRLYTRVTLQVAVVGTMAAVSIADRGPGPAVGIVVCALAAVTALEVQPSLATSSRPRPRRRWVDVAVALVLATAWVVFVVVAARASSNETVDDARVAGACAAVLATVALVPFTRFRWWLLVAVSAATGFGFHPSPGAGTRASLLILAVGAVVVVTTLATLWGLRVVDDLDQARDVEARLQVAEERLRFSRDLHDVVGRSFSAIAVKSELAATLARAGSPDRASAEMDEVKGLAVESMGEMRKLVHRYRDIDLAGEVAGARSLLSAAGCDLVVQGDPAAVPERFHEVAAWVVREGTTNIVKHSAATAATLALGAAGMTLSNGGVVGEPGRRSGLRGLAERVGRVGGRLDTTTADGEFVLEVVWEAS